MFDRGWKSSICVKFMINNLMIGIALKTPRQIICAYEYVYKTLRKNNDHIDNSTIGIWQIEDDV